LHEICRQAGSKPACASRVAGRSRRPSQITSFGGTIATSQEQRSGAGEDEKQRRDRELIELLNELRVALPGVQVLFAFLLTVPFSQRFASVTPVQKHVYYAAVLCTAAASALLIAPTAYHRIAFRTRDKERMLITANHLAIVGTAFLAVSIVLVVWVITDLLFDGALVPSATAAVAALYAWLWYLLPIKRRADDAASSR
jgi:hypothetical protein